MYTHTLAERLSFRTSTTDYNCSSLYCTILYIRAFQLLDFDVVLLCDGMNTTTYDGMRKVKFHSEVRTETTPSTLQSLFALRSISIELMNVK